MFYVEYIIKNSTYQMIFKIYMYIYINLKNNLSYKERERLRKFCNFWNVEVVKISFNLNIYNFFIFFYIIFDRILIEIDFLDNLCLEYIITKIRRRYLYFVIREKGEKKLGFFGFFELFWWYCGLGGLYCIFN